MKAYLITGLFLLFYMIPLKAADHPKCHIEHYGLSDGLPQRVVMSILQDRKGFLWFATWDGLCKFDGYNYTTFKTKESDSVFMRSNRIDKMTEDGWGNIWVLTYGREAFRFDPKIGKYTMAFSQENGKPFIASKILSMPSGKVWLISDEMGAICVPDTTHSYLLLTEDNSCLKSNRVYTVHEDADLNSWILTGNGLVQVSSDGMIKTHFVAGIHELQGMETCFYSAFETETEIWLGASNGLIWRYHKKEECFDVLETIAGSAIVDIERVSEDLIIMLTSNDGFLLYNSKTGIFRKVDRSTHQELPTNHMVSCYVDRTGNVWIEMNYTGVLKYNVQKDQIRYYSISSSKVENDPFAPVMFIVEDQNNHLWIHPKGGGFAYYDKDTEKLIPFYNDPKSTDWRFSDELHDVFVDKQNTLWLSTRTQGLEKVVFDSDLFKLNEFNDKYLNLDLIKNEVVAIWEDKDKQIWMGNRDGLIQVYDAQKEFKGYLCTNGVISRSGTPIKAMAYSFMADRYGKIWIGTKGKGVYVLNPEGSSYQITHYQSNPADINSLSSNLVYSVHEDSRGHIWVGTYGGGLNLFDEKKGNFIHHRNGLSGYPTDMGYSIRTINSHNDKIYVGTTFGLIVFSAIFDNPNAINYKTYSKTFEVKNGLRANDIFEVYRTKSNELYIATFGGGLAKVTHYDSFGFPVEFKTYDTTNGLHSDIIFSLIEDNHHHVWINGEGGLSKFDPVEETFEYFNDVSQILGEQYFSEASPILTYQNEIILGCTKGILSFYPDEISQNEYNPYLALIKLNIPDKKTIEGNHIDDISKVVLNHDENVFNIEFAALDFTNPQSISYAYKLEGADKEWTYCQNQRIVNYTKLPPGKYVFKVRSTNSNGVWMDNERALSITIKPAFWQTKLAYLGYLLFLILLFYAILRAIFVFYRMKDKMALEQEETEMKTRFFTDISHEIRTPLTMIVSPIEEILDNEKTHSEIKPQLQLILRNANRMLKMVNQILDFRKIQKQKLQIKEIPLGLYVEELCNTTLRIAENQHVELKVNNQIGESKVWVDSDAIEKVLSNLISNSIKHSVNGREIKITVYKKDKQVVLQVRDEGEGMTKEVLSKLFTRFASYNKDRSKPSTGIGLSIVKEIVDKHHAKIGVESDLNRGTCFTIAFREGLEHFSEDINVDIIQIPETVVSEAVELEQKNELHSVDAKEEESSTQLTLLVVEDDPELRGFIRSVLEPYYQVYEARNGKEGYLRAIKYMPDFIVSDIMMPEMDGIEFLQKIRTNKDTSHIPFILLTAKTSIDDELEGITYGADDYITKPFNVKLLRAKIHTIIQQRKLYMAHFLGQTSVADLPLEPQASVSQYKMTEHDEAFLEKVRSLIEENLDNGNWTVDNLVEKTSLSRRVFFNKLKSLTGLAPVEFIREYKIKRSVDFLKDKRYTIKEITYMIGFSDFRYYSKCFKELYKMTPSEYRNRMNR